MVYWRRMTALAGASALVAGVMAMVPVSAQAAASEPGGIVVWGGYGTNFTNLVRVSHPAAQGPWTTSSSGTSIGTVGSAEHMKDILALTPTGEVEALPGATAPWADTSPVAGKTVVSVSTNGTSAAAVTSDGSVVKWGSPRGGLTNKTWTAAELDDEAIAVDVVSPVHMNVLLADGRVSRITTNGANIVTRFAAGDAPAEVLTGVVQISGERSLRADGSVVRVDDILGWVSEINASASDPVVAINGAYAATESKVYRDTPGQGFAEDTAFPADQLDGDIVQLAAAGNSAVALRTSTNHVVVWAKGGDSDPNFALPSALEDVEVLDLTGGYTFRAVVAGDVPDLEAFEVTTQPTIAGTPQVGKTLTATPAVFNDQDVEITHLWYAGVELIAGATDATFVLSETEVGTTITYESRAKRASDGATLESSRSNGIGPVDPEAAALAVTTQPTIVGTPQVGQTLTATPAVFNDATATVAHQWLTGGTPIAGATGTTLPLTAGQLGATITHISTATRAADGAVLASDASNTLGPVTAAPPPKIVPTASISAAGGTYGKATTVSVAVSNGAAGNVTLRVDGVPVGAAAVNGGAATFSVPATTTAGTHVLGASYEGSATHTATSAAGTLSIAKRAAGKPTFKASKAPTSKKAGKATVTVTAPSGLAKATGKIRVTLKKGGSTKQVTVTLSGGKRSIKLPKLKKGTWKVTVTYNGDSNYTKGTSKSYKLKIKK